ncbi:uncharacterized protein CTRU02_214204 [Colletotrichum truncatum]|uniref:Uncharacterized protein n=1 Tax=Colletotrichum truncatum TaxID=5467 RepID=A0ACC3YHX6_COLTU|nr:uncharacterized protein CTRU02_11283 [Colletotrichum truncatum]KAF6786025.1 hypothetical protein CTRU02_11283 [Colletotrichum truncatum]
MDVLLRTLARRKTSSPTRGGGGGDHNQSRRDENNGGGHNRQFELVLEVLARGLVEYAVRKYMPNHNNDRDGHKGHHDNRLGTRSHPDEDQRPRGGVPNSDMEMWEHLGKSILAKAIEKFGKGGEDKEEVRGDVRAKGLEGTREMEGRSGSRDRYTNSRGRSHNRAEDHGEEHGRRRRSRDGYRRRSREDYRRDGSREHSRHHRDERQGRRRHTDYAPLKAELEALSNAIISLNARQPGHPNCEFYDAFVERSGKVQDSIGAVLVQVRRREDRREERRGRRRG